MGKFVSFTADGCPDGHMSIRESERPDTEGQWCGSAWGYTVYYSEGHSLNVTLLLEKLSEQVGAADGCFIILVQATKTIVIVWLQAIQKSHVGFVLIITCCGITSNTHRLSTVVRVGREDMPENPNENCPGF